ncbi:MAG: bifunctional metallophosphatase/5'-nucleotidase [Firmicutes bacterium]|nr:bifunctional metallophosphatase/5'-nucleotidase [Bacillota bacterium]
MTRYKKLTLLHANDMHGDFLEESADGVNTGGISMLSGYVSKVRSEEPNTIFAIAGDMFRGSVIDSEYQGLSTIELMNVIAPDVVSLGNHEVDYGLTHLMFIEKCAKFPIICANFRIKSNNASIFEPFHIVEIDDMKILFIGILTAEVLSSIKDGSLITSFLDITDAAEEIGRICDAYNALDIDLTVLLTHIGIEEDKLLAEKLDPRWGVDLIIGGHSHTLTEEPIVINGVPIVQAGFGTKQIGRFDITIDRENNCIEDYSWQIVPIESTHCPRDLELESLLDHFRSQTDEKYSHVITRLARKLTHPGKLQETEIGDLFADALRNSLGTDMFFMASGSIRKPELGPIVTHQDLKEIFPFDDAAYILSVKGSQLKRMLSRMLREEIWSGIHCEFYQMSRGVAVEWSRKEQKILSLSYRAKPIEDDKQYTVGFQAYHYQTIEENLGISIEELSENKKPVIAATSCFDVLEEYLSTHQNLNVRSRPRIVILDAPEAGGAAEDIEQDNTEDKK